MTIDVLALGESLKYYKPNGNITVGVNDIYRHYKTDYLVLVDPPDRFTEPDRLKTIMESSPKKFLCCKPWPVPNFELIQLSHARGSLIDLNTNKYPFSNNSAFVACVHAYKLGATNIIVWGADFKSHQALSNPRKQKTILKDFKNLKDELSKRRVNLFVGHSFSLLSEILPVLKHCASPGIND